MNIYIMPDGAVIYPDGGQRGTMLWDGVSVTFPGDKNYEKMRRLAEPVPPSEADWAAQTVAEALAARQSEQ